jgi:hypothetical protein
MNHKMFPLISQSYIYSESNKDKTLRLYGYTDIEKRNRVVDFSGLSVVPVC